MTDSIHSDANAKVADGAVQAAGLDPAEIGQGFAFADQLFSLCHRLGPTGYSPDQREALGDHLIDAACDWVRLHAPASQEVGDGNVLNHTPSTRQDRKE